MVGLWRFAKGVLVAGMLSALSVSGAAVAQPEGRFLTPLDLRDTGNGRDFMLLQEFQYVDPERVLWIVPAGSIVNGTSIPQALWSFVGSPWTGRYRRASVVHDYFFTREKYGSDAIHKVFYDAMLSDGVGLAQAKLMYYAVLRFNDRWEKIENNPYECNLRQAEKYSGIRCMPTPLEEYIEPPSLRYKRIGVEFSVDELKAMQQRLTREDISLPELEKLAEENYDKAKKSIVGGISIVIE